MIRFACTRPSLGGIAVLTSSRRMIAGRAAVLEELFSSTRANVDELEGEGESQSSMDDVSLAERLARRGDAVQAELQRLRWVLTEKPQVLSTKRSWSLRPAVFHRSTTKVGDDSTVSQPRGTSSVIFGPAVDVLKLLSRKHQSATSSSGTALAERPADAKVRHFAHMKSMHQLNYYGTIELVPKKNLQHSCYIMAWNGLVAAQHACTVPIYYLARAISRRGESSLPVAVLSELLHGFVDSLRFIAYGFVVSPLVHIPNGILNALFGTISFFRGNLFFDAVSGRYYCCDLRHVEYLLEQNLNELTTIKALGTVEFRRKKMEPDGKFKDQIKNIGFRIRKSQQSRMRRKSGMPDEELEDERQDPYEVLRLKKSSTSLQIKQQYKKLAKVFHPDAVQAQQGGVLTDKQKEESQRKFESLSEAYQILSNPERKRAFDQAGHQGVKLSETKMGRFASSNAAEMVQSVFGGRTFKETFLGELYKSHWDLRYQHQVCVSLHGFECMQSIRVALLAMKLKEILDVHALQLSPESAVKVSAPGGKLPSASQRNIPHARTSSNSSAKQPTTDPLLSPKNIENAAGTSAAATQRPQTAEFPICDDNKFSLDYKKRCEFFAKSLQGACFGPALLDDIGRMHVVSAKRFLGVESFYQPKLYVYKNLSRGFSSIFAGFKAQVRDKTEEELAKMVLAEWFNMEYHNVMTDGVVVLRYTAQLVLRDASATPEVLRRRAFALWYLGETLKQCGAPFGDGKQNDEELVAYLQQAATSVKSTGPPPKF
jgi:curved DNA-binding protein CbpA